MGIRVNTGEKRIDVNDKGEYIVLNFGDVTFPDRFYEMADRIKARADDAVTKAAEIDAQCGDDADRHSRASAKLFRSVHEEIMADVDGFFGEGTCRKVFGDIVPGIEMYDDFFTQLMPYFEQFGKERAKRMSKYSAARTGNV